MNTRTYLLLFLLMSFSAMAQKKGTNPKVHTLTKGVHLVSSIPPTIETNKEIARIHLFKNNRIKKALSFQLKAKNSKIV